jgi:hypothetical protein
LTRDKRDLKLKKREKKKLRRKGQRKRRKAEEEKNGGLEKSAILQFLFNSSKIV